MNSHPMTKLPAHIRTEDFAGGRLYVKTSPALVSLLDSEWTAEELFAIAADIAQRAAPARANGAPAATLNQPGPLRRLQHSATSSAAGAPPPSASCGILPSRPY
jgi:hypothetical protein